MEGFEQAFGRDVFGKIYLCGLSAGMGGGAFVNAGFAVLAVGSVVSGGRSLGTGGCGNHRAESAGDKLFKHIGE